MIWLDYYGRMLLPKLPNIWKSSSNYYIVWKIYIYYDRYLALNQFSSIKFIIELGVSLIDD